MSVAIILAGGGFQGLPVLRALHALGWRVVLADSHDASVNRFEADAFIRMPPVADFQAFRARLLALVRETGARAIFPTTSYDLPLLARLRPEIEALGPAVYVSAPGLVELLASKIATTHAAREAGLPMLETIDPTEHDWSSPLIGKPDGGWGGQGLQRLRNASDWKGAADAMHGSSYLWQRELADFTEWSVDFAIDRDGVPSRMVCRRRQRVSGGFAVLAEVAAAPALEALARHAALWLGRIGGFGIFNLQFLEEKGGSLWLTDLNPRPGTSSVAAQAAGTNLVEALICGTLAKPPKPGLVIRTLTERFLPRIGDHISGAVFDLDETLISQKHWMETKLSLVLDALMPSVGPEVLARFAVEARRVIDEGPWDRLIDVALQRSGETALTATDVIALWRVASPARALVHADARSFLAALRQRGLRIGLLSDNPGPSQRQKLAVLPSDFCFDAEVLTDEIGRSKPNPEGFLAIAERLGLSPNKLMMVGDSPWRDALGAYRAGYAACLIVRRVGSMSNPCQTAFMAAHPDAAGITHWVDSLFGAEATLGQALDL